MAKSDKAAPAAKSSGQGAAIVLPNGARRIDFIRDRYYNDGISRSDIKKEINEQYEKSGEDDKKIAYQIVFAATKNKEVDPRTVEKAAPAAAEAS